jgi:hypothetical protein
MSIALRLVSALALGLCACPGFAGCSEDKATQAHEEYLTFCDLPVSCRDIIRACHAKDDTTNAEIHECHETGHDVGTEAACGPVHDSCVTLCNAAPDIGVPEPLPACGDSGISDAGGD